MNLEKYLSPKKIVMYTTETCADCYRARAFFEANEIDYDRVALEGDDEATQFVLEVNHGMRSVPTIVFPDGTILVEPTWTQLRAKFSKA